MSQDHKIYQKCEEENADAVAWVFSDKNKFEKYYYKHPELKDDDVRIRILSAGLCMSDSHFCRGVWGD